MGHLRLGRLPKTRRWNAVMNLLDAEPSDTAGVARAVVNAADNRLSRLGHDEALVYCFWLLTRITWAARGPQFRDHLADLGIEVSDSTSALGLVSKVSEQARMVLAQHPESGPFGELASLSLRRALTDTIGTQDLGLFGSSIADVQYACRTYSSRKQFGILATRFFADFFSRTLRYFVDREVANYVGPGRSIPNIQAGQQFGQALDLYARQSAHIVEDFAAGWYSKHNWETQGQISTQEVQGFVSYALRKLRMEVKREAAQA